MKKIINENFKQSLVIQQKDSSIEILNNTIDELLEQIYSKTEEIEDIKKYSNEVEQEKLNMQESIILNNKKFKELLKERDKFVAENEELREKLKRAESIEKHRDQLMKVNRRLSKSEEQLQEENEKLKNDYEMIKSFHNEIERENESLFTELVELKKSTVPVHHDVKKPKFRLEDFQGKYVMHCKTLESAKTFCKFMKSGKSPFYTSYLNWDNGYTCFNLNIDDCCSFEHAENHGYTILNFDNFDWEE